MLDKRVSPEIMRFAVVFIILFRISFGFHLHFGLDQIFHGLTAGKSSLFNFGKYHESKQANQTHDSSFSKDSKKESGSSSKDPLQAIVGTADAVLNGTIVKDSLKAVAGTVGKGEKVLEGTLGTLSKTVGKAEGIVEGTLETVAKKAGKAEGIVEDTLETVAKKGGKAEGIGGGSLGTVAKTAGEVLNGGNLKDSLKTVVGTVNKTISGGTVTDNMKTVTKIAGGSVHGVENTLGTAAGLVSKAASDGSSGDPLKVIVETAGGGRGAVGTSETVGGKSGKAKTGGTLDKSLEIVTSKVGGVVPALEGSLKTVSGKTGGSVSSSVAESSSGVVAGKAGGAVRTLGDSLETVLGDTSGAISSSAVESSLGLVAGKKSKTKTSGTLDKSLEIVTLKSGGGVPALESSLKTVSGSAGRTVSSSVAESSSGVVAGKAGGAVRALGGSFETVLGDTGGSLSSSNVESSSGDVAGKTGKAKTRGNLDKSLEIVTSKAGGIVPALEGSLKTVSGKAGVAESSSAVRTLGGSLETVSGKTGGAVSSSAVGSSSGVVAGMVGKVSGGKVSAGGAVRTIEGALETLPGSSGGAVSSSIVRSSLGSVDGKASRVISDKVSLGTITGNEDEVEYDISEDYLEIIPKNVRETLESRVASVSGGGEKGLNEEIQKVPRDISNKSAANSLQTIITDVTVGEVCYSKSVVTGFPSYPPVSKFVHIFIQGVEASELLTKLFNVTDATSLQLSQFKYRYISDVFRKIGFIDANDIAAATVRHIAKYFDVIVPEVLLRVYANAFANYIFAEGFLTNGNAEKHAQNYIRAMQESAEGNGVICDCDYNRNFQALGDGVFSFLLSVGEPSHSQAWGTAFYYAHEWLLAAVDYGSLRDLTVKK